MDENEFQKAIDVFAKACKAEDFANLIDATEAHIMQMLKIPEEHAEAVTVAIILHDDQQFSLSTIMGHTSFSSERYPIPVVAEKQEAT